MRISQMTGTEGTWTPTALRIRNVAARLYAKEFHGAAQKTRRPLVRAYLLGHALELYLKSFLLTSGLRTRTLRSKRFNHDLAALLDEAEARGLGTHLRVSPQLRTDLKQLNNSYSSKSLEYFSLLHLLVPPVLPRLDRLFRFAGSLSAALVRLHR